MGRILEMDGPRADPITEVDLSNERTLHELAESYARKHDALCERLLARAMAGAEVEGGAAVAWDERMDRDHVRRVRLFVDGRCVYERIEGPGRALTRKAP